MTQEAFTLHDALDYIDIATEKATFALQCAADYFDDNPIDPARIIAEQDQIRLFVNIALDYLNQIKREYTDAMTATEQSNT